MNTFSLYRRRLIPDECVLLDKDVIVKHTKDVIVTKWKTLNPKTAFQYGASCYFLKDGIKLSKFYRKDNSLFCWYCDIVQFDYKQESNTMIVTDLLADVIIMPDNAVKVVDLDELAEAFDKGLLSADGLKAALLQLNTLLSRIYANQFFLMQAELNDLGL